MSSIVVRRVRLVAAFMVAAVLACAGASGAAPRVTEYSVARASVAPCTVAVDRSSGNVYFSAMLGPTSSSVGSIGMLDPATGTVRKIPLPSALASPGGIAFGPDGNVYFAEYLAGNAIGRLDPRTDTVAEFPLPTPLSQPSSLVLGSDGGIWFIENGTQRLGRFDPTNQIGVFDVATHQFRTYTSPTPLSLPQGIAFAADTITRFNPVTHQQTNIRTSTVASGPCDFDATSQDTLWFGELTAGRIGRLQVTQ